MQIRTPRALAAAAALALFASACTDAPTTPPSVRADGGRAWLSTGSGPTLVSNSVKYRDTGGKPARGRSGNAAMEAYAWIDKQGLTTVQYSTWDVINYLPEWPVSRLQVKASAPDGQHKFTRNVKASDDWGRVPSSMELRGLGRGDHVQLQAHVEGIDPHRPSIVTVEQTVKRLPDLTVEMTAPAEVQANTYVNILAVVSERNGDLGAYAECELLVAGQVVDRASGAWVDAGDAVTCAMTWRFQNPGTYPLEVRVRSGNEWDTANNTDKATLTVHGGSPRFSTIASFQQTTSVDSSIVFDSWRDTQLGYGSEYRNEDVWTTTDQVAYMSGIMPAHTTGPVDLRVSMSTGGRVVDTAEWTYDVGDYSYWCTSHTGGRAMFWMCSSDGGPEAYTDFSYAFVAGSVTYHSRGYSKTWDQLANPEEYVYHWNDQYGYDDAVPPGNDWTFDVRLNTPGGEHVITRALQLTRSELWDWSNPYSCSSWDEPDWGYSSTYCEGRTIRGEMISGSASD